MGARCDGLRLAQLEHDQCRFAVNAAAPGETHLFCGEPVAGRSSWCAHHLERVIGAGTEGERRAARALMRAEGV